MRTPTTVATNDVDVGASSQRKTFYALTRFWVFYREGTSVKWRSKQEGGTWSDAQIAFTSYSGYTLFGFDACVVDSEVMLLIHDGISGTDGTVGLVFKKGTLADTGNITWSDPVEIVSPRVKYNWSCYHVAKAADGTYWIATPRTTPNWVSPYAYYKIYSSPDGITWTERYSKTRVGGVFEARYVTSVILPEASGAVVYFIYIDYEENDLYWVKWNGSSMSGETLHSLTNKLAIDAVHDNAISGCSDGNNLKHIVWIGADNKLYYKNWDGTTWSSETCLDSTVTCTYPTIGYVPANNNLHVFWIRGAQIYHRKYTTTWETADQPFGTSFTNPVTITCDIKNNVHLGAVWREGSASPYSIKHDRISIVLYTISGVTRDSAGNPLGGCTVWLFTTLGKLFVEEKTSDVNGNYSFNVGDNTTQYFIRAHKDGTPNVFGTTDRNLVGS